MELSRCPAVCILINRCLLSQSTDPRTPSPGLSPTIEPRLCQIRSEEHTSELQSRPHLVCRLLLEKNNTPLPAHVSRVDFDHRRPSRGDKWDVRGNATRRKRA